MNNEDDSLGAAALTSFLDKKYLAASSHYQLLNIKIIKEMLHDFDKSLTKMGYRYTVLTSYCGRCDKGPVMSVGIRKEDKNKLTDVISKYQIV